MSDIVERLRIDFAHFQRTGLASVRLSRDEIGALFAEIDRLRADLAQPAAPGWQWVPMEPTPEMVEAMARAWQQAVESDDPNECIAEWRAAIAAAPQAPQPGAQGA